MADKENKDMIGETDEIDNIEETEYDIEVKDVDDVDSKESGRSYYCYLLRNHHKPHINRTYNGYTVNPAKRIRQHNQEIKGGAKYTKIWGEKTWEIYCLITGFPDHHNALQCEWRIKHPAPKRTRPQRYNSPEGRIIGLNEILKLDRWTGSSTIDNKDLELKIWILEEYADLLTDIPDNIDVDIVSKIDINILKK